MKTMTHVKNMFKAFALSGLLGWAFAAEADTTTFQGVSVDYGNASASRLGDELVLTYSVSGTLKISNGVVDARILAVGGGGGGGGGYYKKENNGTIETCPGGGGDGGQVVEVAHVVYGSLSVVVGSGGGGGSSATDGATGGDSSVKGIGFQDIVAHGGYWGERGAKSFTAIAGSGASGDGASGVKSSITGTEMTYGAGGGIGSGMSNPSAAGANSGNGGKGGGTSSKESNRKGAAGGSGIVVVRIAKGVPNVKAVDDLTITETFVVSPGKTFSPIASVPEGVELTGDTSSSAVGYHQFIASLKPGYIWSNGLVDTPRVYNWRIVEKEDDIPWINVTKLVRVDPEHPSNAWIAVRGMVPQVQKVPNVLFIGTECYAHSLTAKNLQKAIEAVATVANIDWHIFKSTTQKEKAGDNRIGTLEKGQTFASAGYAKLVFDTNNHHAARKFYETLDNVRTNETLSTKYDYIILEFDGSRLADQYTQKDDADTKGSLGPYEHEAEVAEFLKHFYAQERVIWMVDNHAANYDKNGDKIGQVEPWDSDYYRPNLYFHNNFNNTLTDAEYKGLIGLLDPEHYKENVTAASQLAETNLVWEPKYCKYNSSFLWYQKGSGKNGTRTIYANCRYPHQVFYDDGAKLNKYLLNFIQQHFQLLFLDKVVEDLDVVSATFYRSAARDDGKIMWDDSEGWEKVADVESGSAPTYYPAAYVDDVLSAKLAINGQEISAGLSNLVEAAWGKMEIRVKDRGTFKDGVEPIYDEVTGKWLAEKNPNDGLASIEKTDPAGEKMAYGDAPAKIQWSFSMYLVEGIVTNGTLWIDGVETNETRKAEGYDCEVTYRGDKGYAIEYITVDGVPLTPEEIDEHLTEYGFTDIHADHEVVVVYTNFVVTSKPYSNYYDGAEHTITVTPPETYGDITDVKVLYSDDGGKTYSDAAPVYSNAGHTVVHYKVVGHQVGYGDEEITLTTGSDTVDILPREVIVAAESARKFYDGKELTAGYSVQREYTDDERESGWGFVNGDDITSVTMTDSSRIGADGGKEKKATATNEADPEKTEFSEGANKDNYIVHYTDGELEVIPVAVRPVVRIYDGVPTNIEVTVTEPPAGTTVKYSYSEGGKYVEAGELSFTGPTNVLESADIWCEVSAPGYGAVTNKATATILPRVVVEQAGSATNAYTGAKLVCSNAAERIDLESAKAKEAYRELGYTSDYPEIDPADAAGFAIGDGFVVAADGNTYLKMTDDSWRIDVGKTTNVLDSAEATVVPELNAQTRYDNYLFFYKLGELVVTNALMGIAASPAEKFYDAEPTNIAWVVTNATGSVIADATISLREKGTTEWIPVADFALYVDTTNVTVEVRAEKSGFADAFAESTVTVWPRAVVEHAKDGEWVYDGDEHRQSAHGYDAVASSNLAKEVYFDLKRKDVYDGEPRDDWADAVGFAGTDKFADVPMTEDSAITDPGTQPNVIDAENVTVADGTKKDNYVFGYLDGTLTVTTSDALTVEAFPAEKFYDGVPTNVTWTVKVGGEPVDDATVYLREKGTAEWVEAKDFAPYLNATNWNGAGVEVEVKVAKDGYESATAESTVLVKPRIVVEHAKDAFKEYGPGETPRELRQPEHYEDTAAEKEKSVEVYGTNPPDTESMGFVPGEGFDQVPMTDESYVLVPGTKPNVIDDAKVTFADGTNPDNYLVFLLDGTLEIRVRDEEVHGDVDVPEESQKVIDKKLDELVKNDPKAGEEPFVKIQMTVTKAENLTDMTRTSKTEAATKEERQIDEIAKKVAKPDRSEFVDIIIERTYDPIVDAPGHEYSVADWDSLDHSDDRVQIPEMSDIIPVEIPVDVPEGMELIGVTRSCKIDEVLSPLTPEEVAAGEKEGYVYDPVKGTVTLYARDFCVFGFHMKKTETPHGPCQPEEVTPHAVVYQFRAKVYTTRGVTVDRSARHSPCAPESDSTCLVMRGRDKTVLDGWIYACVGSCGMLESASMVVWDSRRQVQLGGLGFETVLLNIMGYRNADAEWSWRLVGTAAYDSLREQTYDLTGSGYGHFDPVAGLYSDFSGIFAGTATPSFDLTSKVSPSNRACICSPSQVLKCDGFADLAYQVEDTVAFGRWAVRYRGTASRLYESTGRLKLPSYVKE